MNKKDALQWCAVNIKTWPQDGWPPCPDVAHFDTAPDGWRWKMTDFKAGTYCLAKDGDRVIHINEMEWLDLQNLRPALANRSRITSAPTITAPSILSEAASAVGDRAAERDTPDGERSMGKTVAAFNAMFGQTLTEEQGWQFMELLKMARSAGGKFRLDDYTDGAAYAALAGECASVSRAKDEQ